MKKSSAVLGIVFVAILFISFKAGQHHHSNNRMVSIFSDVVSNFEQQLQHQFPTEILKASEIEFFEVEEKVNLGFDTMQYLPLGFNAYAGMEFEAQDLEVFELEEEVDLGFDTAPYLPNGFNAYSL